MAKTLDKIKNIIIGVLIILIVGTSMGYSHYKNKAVEAALEKAFEELTAKINLKDEEIIKNNKIIDAFSEELLLQEKEIQKKNENIAKLKKKYKVLVSSTRVDKKKLEKEVEDANLEEIINKFNSLGYPSFPCTPTSK